jgi:ABC-type lipoprotein release transport system permease subunit
MEFKVHIKVMVGILVLLVLVVVMDNNFRVVIMAFMEKPYKKVIDMP